MSARLEALSLRTELKGRIIEGNRLLTGNPSMEEAIAYRDRCAAALATVGLEGRVYPSVESRILPEGVITVAQEGIRETLRNIIRWFSKRPSKTPEEKKPEEKALPHWEVTALKLKAYTDPAWRASAEMHTGTVSLSGTRGAFFFRGHTAFTRSADILKEMKKDVGLYSAIEKTVKGPTMAYIKWANQTWALCEKYYESLSDEEQDALNDTRSEPYKHIVDILIRQGHSVPPLPAEKVKVSTEAKLGFPAPDVFVGPPQYYENDGPGWVAKETPESAQATVEALKPNEVVQALALYESLMGIAERMIYFIDDNNISISGFDDYPWRHDGMGKALDEVARTNRKAICFDGHFITGVITTIHDQLAARAEGLGEAIVAWIDSSYITKPKV